MKTDKSIFGLRFGANVELYPTQEELRAFLESPKQIGRREVQRDDLTTYSKMLEELMAFENHLRHDAGPGDLRERIFYGVLSQSCFFNTALKADVEYFKYHVHSLLTLDFKKPAAFIKSAKEEINRFNPNKRDDAAKLARLRGMISEREREFETLQKRRTALVEELMHIARYVRDNLVKVEKLCETSIVVLVDPKIAGNEERRIIGDIKTSIKEELRSVLQQGTITKQHLEAAKKAVDAVSREASVLIREDIYTITRLYESVYEHAGKIVRELDALMAELNGKSGRDPEASGKLFAQLEQLLVSLISGYHFELETASTHPETAQENILLEKRKEMLEFLFELLMKERRLRVERRTDADRRKFKNPGYKGSERRMEKERRVRKSRRNT